MHNRIREVVPQMNCMGEKRIHILICTSNWTNKKEVMHVSRLKRCYSVNNSRWASGPDNWILTSVPEVYGVWNLATNYHGAYFLSFLQTSSLSSRHRFKPDLRQIV